MLYYIYLIRDLLDWDGSLLKSNRGKQRLTNIRMDT